ncbi:hypothetical protein MNBD_GAMMA18-1943 [hydrothermal vent metagenome]|uniref:Uncharacterized protein n=1 Tax=hydrothermal vent metagenome TaxID=652676 RepID=A0A3B0YZC4_9ZZZZ
MHTFRPSDSDLKNNPMPGAFIYFKKPRFSIIFTLLEQHYFPYKGLFQ